MTSDETWQAYNDWGGYSLYTGNATGSPWCCSAPGPGPRRAGQLQPPVRDPLRHAATGRTYFFYAEFPMIQFLEKNGYDVCYVEPGQTSPRPARLDDRAAQDVHERRARRVLDAGEVANVTAARNAGVNLAFFTGNRCGGRPGWRRRQYGNEPYRTLITYKESLDSAQTDPADPPTWTGAWRDPRFSPPGDGGQPQNALTGQLWTVNCCSYAIRCRPPTPSCDCGEIRLWPACNRARPTRCRTRRSATSGTRTSTTGSGRPASSTCRRRSRTSPQVMLDYQEDLARATRPNT